MAHRSAAAFLVLHSLRLKGFASPDVVAASTGLDQAGVEKAVAQLAEAGLVAYREGRVEGWMLRPSGRSEHARLLAEDLAAAGCRPVVDHAYRCFLGLDARFKPLCTEWQLRDGVRNDHADARYDDEVLGRLDGLHAEVLELTAGLVAEMTRFATYPTRLSSARARLGAGEQDWFTKPLIGSYHDVWMELHEDLLVTLGIERREGES